MPIYEYVCGSCEQTVDVLQKVSDPAPEQCAQCGAQGPMSRKVSRTSFVLKGGGWYKDLYGSTRKDSGGESSSSAASTASTPAASTPASSAPAAAPAASSSSGEGGGSSSTTSTTAKVAAPSR